MALRGYQTDLKTKVQSALRAKRKVVMQLPTGGGKTMIATEIIKDQRGPVWFVCHRKEIRDQASRHLDDAGIKHGLIAVGCPATKSRVQVASVDLLPRRLGNYPAPALIVWDECHRAAAQSWRKIIEQFPNARHLGLTATPERLDGKGLDDLFNTLVCGPSVRELIRQGQLSEYRYFAPSEPDLTSARMKAGDYAKADLNRIMNKPVLIGNAVEEYQKHTPGKRALAFCTSIEASKALVRKFKRAGIAAAHVDGDTKEAEREAATAALASGKIKVLSNVEIFTEGFDLPAIDAVILMRPTKSLRLFLQMVGRGLRRTNGKHTVTIFDHAGLRFDHGFPDAEYEWSLDGGARARRIAALVASGEKMRRCPECGCVHHVAAECPECGFAYPTGREVGEFDGELTEVTAATMLADIVPASRLANILGVAPTTISNFAKRGMPQLANGMFSVHECKGWLNSNPPLGRPPLFVESPSDYESRACFRNRLKSLGLPGHIAYSKDIPSAPNGWVHINSAVSMVCERRDFFEKNGRTKPSIGVDIVSKSEFAKLVGISPSYVHILLKRGLPNYNGWVLKSEAIEWVDTHLARKPGIGRELRSKFADRIGVHYRTVANLAKAGMPCSPNGQPYILPALEWVRDNRPDIKIPASAWPKKPAKKAKR